MEDRTRNRRDLPEETGADTAEMGSTTLSAENANGYAAYTNPYAGQIQELYEGITSREPFQYDVDEDAMYAALRDQYITGGQMAMMDTMGQAAQLTGGYGNSYAQGVGQQAYQGYLQGLNEQLPDLYNMALNNYIQTGDAMLQQYGMLQDMAADDYGKFIDDRNFQYQQEQDQAAADRWQQDFDYQQSQDQAAADRWQQDFDYQQSQDQAAADRWQQEFEYGQSIDDRNFEYQQSRDQAELDAQEQADQRAMALAMLERGIRPSDEMLAAAGLNMEYVNAMYPQRTGGGDPGTNGTITERDFYRDIQNMRVDGVSNEEILEYARLAVDAGLIDQSDYGNIGKWLNK